MASNSITVTVATLLFLVGVQWHTVKSDASTLYVVPYGQQLMQCKSEECFTLEELINDVHNFSSNTTILMLPGKHETGTNTSSQLLFQDFHYVEISAIKSKFDRMAMEASIECTYPFNFKFMNVIHVRISGIVFNNCGSLQMLSRFTFNVTVCVTNSSNVVLENVTITNTKGIGLFVQNVHENLTLTRLNLTKNEVNCYIEYASEATTNLTTLNYLIQNSMFSYGNALQPGKYLPATISPIVTPSIGAGGLNIRLNHIGTIQTTLTNNTLHENQGLRGNLYFQFDGRSLEHVTHVIIEYLISTYAKKANSTLNNKGLYVKGKPNTFNLNILIFDSIFKESCITAMLITSIRFTNVSIHGGSCFTSLNFLKAQYVHFSNVSITQTFGKHTMKLFQSTIRFSGQVCFYRNMGGIMLERNSRLAFDVGSNTQLVYNTVLEPHSNFASVLYAEDSEVVITDNAYVNFENNTSTLGGAITAVASRIEVMGPNSTLLFVRNRGTNGGAIAMYDSSQISVYGKRDISVRFIENFATQKGGAIYVDTTTYFEKRNRHIKDFIKLESYIRQCPKFEYINNVAILSGNNIYGGWLTISHTFCKFFGRNNTNNALLSSDPVRVCMCNNSVPNCNISEHRIEVYPGETYGLNAVAVGWQYGTVPAIVQARFDDPGNTTKVKASQYVQSVDRDCTHLRYKIHSQNNRETLHLVVERTNIPELNTLTVENILTLLLQELTLDISVKSCPPGFSFNTSLSICTCNPLLANYDIQCDKDTFKMVRSGRVWISANDNTSEITISKFCPYDYCDTSNKTQLLDLDDPDKQCASNHSGILCGKCHSNLSQVLGTTKCMKCSNLWILLFVPIFALAGAVLVLFITALNLTVSVGTINGLIFYANIVRANQAIFFPPEISNTFLSWFIAWINLDFGIEACFYNGLDAYAKTWLQFLFPLYILFIVLAMIFLSRRFDTVAKMAGKNAVSVLATLFLLSYAKLLRIIITVLQPAVLFNVLGNNHRKVWLYDGNVDYLRGKHIPLFITALAVLLFLSIPYTLTLLTIQWLQTVNHYRVTILFWVHKLKPLFDAYTGPYKDKHRYWTGMLLLVRVLLFLVFSLNTFNNPSINLLAILVVFSITLSHPFLVGRVYKSRLTNLIEASFHLNMTILAALTLYQISTSGSVKWSTITSVSIALITFVFIVIKHFIQRIKTTGLTTKLKRIKQHLLKVHQTSEAKEDTSTVDTTKKDKASEDTVIKMTHTFVQLREPLLDCSSI